MISQRIIFVFVSIALLVHFASNFIDKFTISNGRSLPLSVFVSKQNRELNTTTNGKDESTTTIYYDPLSSKRKNNWTIMLELNDGAFDLLRNWYSYFSKLSVGIPVIAIAEDEIVFKKLQSDKYSLIKVEKSDYINIPNASRYNTSLFRQLMSVRAAHLLKFLPNTRYLLYSDVDTVWLKNPIPYFTGDFDLWMPLDRKMYCAGFFAITVKRKTTDLVREWDKVLRQRISVNQGILNNLIKMSTGIRVASLNVSLFPSGDRYFSKIDDQDRAKAVIVHNNFIKGIDLKIRRFKKFKLWNISATLL